MATPAQPIGDVLNKDKNVEGVTVEQQRAAKLHLSLATVEFNKRIETLLSKWSIDALAEGVDKLQKKIDQAEQAKLPEDMLIKAKTRVKLVNVAFHAKMAIRSADTTLRAWLVAQGPIAKENVHPRLLTAANALDARCGELSEALVEADSTGIDDACFLEATKAAMEGSPLRSLLQCAALPKANMELFEIVCKLTLAIESVKEEEVSWEAAFARGELQRHDDQSRLEVLKKFKVAYGALKRALDDVGSGQVADMCLDKANEVIMIAQSCVDELRRKESLHYLGEPFWNFN